MTSSRKPWGIRWNWKVGEISSDENIFPPPEILERCEFLTDLGDYNAVMDRAWSELKLK
jgi:hypothetical protein